MVKDIILKLYLLPINLNERLAMSARNRILPGRQHLKGLTFALKQFTAGDNFGDTIIDVGCFEGGTSLFFHKAIKNVKVIGFEANSRSFNTAIENTKAYQGVTIENYAVSDFCGTTEFYITDNKVSSSLSPISGVNDKFTTVQVEKVNTITLDEYLKSKGDGNKKILALKLDVQGHELKVLKGAQNTLKNTLFVLSELSNHNNYTSGCQYYDVDQALREKGFKLHNIFAPFSHSPFLYEFDAIYINEKLISN